MIKHLLFAVVIFTNIASNAFAVEKTPVEIAESIYKPYVGLKANGHQNDVPDLDEIRPYASKHLGFLLDEEAACRQVTLCQLDYVFLANAQDNIGILDLSVKAVSRSKHHQTLIVEYNTSHRGLQRFFWIFKLDKNNRWTIDDILNTTENTEYSSLFRILSEPVGAQMTRLKAEYGPDKIDLSRISNPVDFCC